MRQSTTPMTFKRTIRPDVADVMTTGFAGKVVPLTYIPLLRGDSASGRVGIDLDLAEMPRPTLNGISANFQAWFVPKSASPKFPGMDEFIHSYQGENIKQIGVSDRTPASFFDNITGADLTTYKNSDLVKSLGIHIASSEANTDLAEAYALIWNFRAAAHSDNITRHDYPSENLSNSTTLGRAFWPSGRFNNVVPDYERALVVGSLDLDVIAGTVPVKSQSIKFGADATSAASLHTQIVPTTGSGTVPPTDTSGDYDFTGLIWADMTGQNINVSLNDIDMARKTQAFAKARAAMAGNDTTGFNNDDALLAEMMQGLEVAEEHFNRPWLLDQKRVPFGMEERHATDAANLDDSVTTGRASTVLNLNVPQNDVGGIIMVTVEVLPDRLYERQGDPAVQLTTVAELPNALRDVQNVEPVDTVENWRIDAAHTSLTGAYGYEPQNAKWQRNFVRLGGNFFQATPGTPKVDQRLAIWQPDVVDPNFNDDHYLCPDPMPASVFALPSNPHFTAVARHNVAIAGLTQIGDILHENSDDYAAISS